MSHEQEREINWPKIGREPEIKITITLEAMLALESIMIPGKTYSDAILKLYRTSGTVFKDEPRRGQMKGDLVFVEPKKAAPDESGAVED